MAQKHVQKEDLLHVLVLLLVTSAIRAYVSCETLPGDKQALLAFKDSLQSDAVLFLCVISYLNSQFPLFIADSTRSWLILSP